MKSLICILTVAATTAGAQAAIKTETVEYKDGDTALEGYLAYDNTFVGKRPAVLIVHEWTGLGQYVKNRAKQIAELGYVALAVDIYGKGVRPANAQEAAKQAGIYRSDRQLMRKRAIASLEQIKKYPFVDPNRIAAI
jgi:dienelactone hydrolase